MIRLAVFWRRLRGWLAPQLRMLARDAAAAGSSASRTVAHDPGAHSASTRATDAAGSRAGWLRVLDHEQLLQSVQAHRAIREIWRQSRVSAAVWERDFAPALRRYAEFVQLAPASEAHHHAHAGGLLSHTIEMTLAAVTWRNGHLLPAGEPIEVIDAQRDAWTYVVFFSALLHDIAKPMTDLRIHWQSADMPDPLRWLPLTGSLPQVSAGRTTPEYLVEFTPKSSRDYSAHSRLAMMLLPGIAPTSALGFLARHPQAFEALNQYLTGQDKDSLLAQIVRKADRASTERSLLSGSGARLRTATAVPLIDLLMQAIGSLLRQGALPLNRSGAAGWVHDGSIWFVAKRLADSVRAWIKANAPDESVPGEAKNDRLFDTWQEHGSIQTNPATGQAVWYVTVHGAGADLERNADADIGGGGGTSEHDIYCHDLTMLRFALVKLFQDPSYHPTPMRGYIEVHARRKAEAAERQQKTAVAPVEAAMDDPSPTAAAGAAPRAQDGDLEHQPADVPLPQPAPAAAAKAKPGKARAPETVIKEPVFNRPKPAPAAAVTIATPEAAPARSLDQKAASSPAASAEPRDLDGAALLQDASPWLDADDEGAAVAQDRQSGVVRLKAAAARSGVAGAPAVPAAAQQQSAAVPAGRRLKAGLTEAALNSAMLLGPMIARSGRRTDPSQQAANGAGTDSHVAAECSAPPSQSPAPIGPVVLMPNVPALGKSAGAVEAPAPSDTALDFMRWLQAALAGRRLKYNETGAAVHFTEQGMALVSPIIFKTYAREIGSDDDADARGLQVQREVIKAGWHMMGPKRTNIVRFEVIGRGGVVRGKLSAVVLIEPDRWVVPVPPANPALKIA